MEEWEPDPREAVKCKCVSNGKYCATFTIIIVHVCTANCGTPSLPPNCHIIFYTSTLEGAEIAFVCQSTFQVWHWSLCKEVNVTAVCTKRGNWEPITDDMCTELTGIIERLFCARFCLHNNIILLIIYRKLIEPRWNNSYSLIDKCIHYHFNFVLCFWMFVWSPLSKTNAESSNFSKPTSSHI